MIGSARLFRKCVAQSRTALEEKIEEVSPLVSAKLTYQQYFEEPPLLFLPLEGTTPAGHTAQTWRGWATEAAARTSISVSSSTSSSSNSSNFCST